MKKLLTLSAALLAASLFFTACSNPSGGDNGGGNSNPGPGSWSNIANWYSGTDPKVFANAAQTVSCGSVTFDGQGGGVYINSNPVETQTGSNVLTPNHFRYQDYKIMQDTDITGFEATASCTSPTAVYGFEFNISSDFNTYYKMFIQGHGTRFYKVINNVETELQGWTNNSAVNEEPSENKITVYKDGNAIKILINGTNIYTINNPEITMGSVGCICGMGYADIQNHRNIKTTYKITKLQR